MLVNFHFSSNADGQGNSKEQSKNNGRAGIDQQIVEIGLISTTGQKKEALKDFYYGIGISVYRSERDGVEINGIADVYAGYPAETNGLRVLDIIVSLDGKPVNVENDIVSDKPRVIVLRIMRGGSMFDVTIQTEKIYFKN